MNEKEIQRILTIHKNMLESSRKRYHEVKKHDPEFIKKNRERSNKWYELNKEKRKEKYDNERNTINAKASYNYYKRKNNLELFKVRHKAKYDILLNVGYIKPDPIVTEQIVISFQ